MAMSVEVWQSLSEHLDRVLELSEPEQSEWMAALSARNPEMAARIAAILAGRAQKSFVSFLRDDGPLSIFLWMSWRP
jgi:hypothetical protein